MTSRFYLYTAPGILKFFTIAVGAVAYGLGVFSYDETTVQEEFFLRSIQTVLIISLIYFSIYLVVSTANKDTNKLVESDMNRAVVSGPLIRNKSRSQDIGFHLTGAITLLVAGGLVIYSAVDNERTYCILIYVAFPHHFCQFYGIKLAAGIVTLFNGLLYTAVAPAVFFMGKENMRLKQAQRPKSFYFGAR